MEAWIVLKMDGVHDGRKEDPNMLDARMYLTSDDVHDGWKEGPYIPEWRVGLTSDTDASKKEAAKDASETVIYL